MLVSVIFALDSSANVGDLLYVISPTDLHSSIRAASSLTVRAGRAAFAAAAAAAAGGQFEFLLCCSLTSTLASSSYVLLYRSCSIDAGCPSPLMLLLQTPFDGCFVTATLAQGFVSRRWGPWLTRPSTKAISRLSLAEFCFVC